METTTFYTRICYHIISVGLNGYMATVTNLKNPVNKWKCGAAPITAMMTVKNYSRGHGVSTIGKPTLHPATDLKGKSYDRFVSIMATKTDQTAAGADSGIFVPKALLIDMNIMARSKATQLLVELGFSVTSVSDVKYVAPQAFDYVIAAFNDVKELEALRVMFGKDVKLAGIVKKFMTTTDGGVGDHESKLKQLAAELDVSLLYGPITEEFIQGLVKD